VLFGLPSLKIKGFYLAVATLAAQFFLIWLFTRQGMVLQLFAHWHDRRARTHGLWLCRDRPAAKCGQSIYLICLCFRGVWHGWRAT
jgi:branched-chain amino acid transport system permease protein